VVIQIQAEREIAAPAERVYRILADYTTHHSRILPPAFTSLVVEEGGVGAGTVIRFAIRLAGRTTTFHQIVKEPEPGRVLVEDDLDTDLATSFTVTPTANGCRVNMDSAWTPRGLQGVFERLFAARMMTPVYEEELRLLDHYAREQTDV
jgi:uncharacterized protein YndB with AHSA1/START domain